MSPGEPPDLRRERLRLARRLHPDLGGDPQAYVEAMAALERRGRTPGPVGSGRRSPRLRTARRLRRARARLPRWVPGARRTFEI